MLCTLYIRYKIMLRGWEKRNDMPTNSSTCITVLHTTLWRPRVYSIRMAWPALCGFSHAGLRPPWPLHSPPVPTHSWTQQAGLLTVPCKHLLPALRHALVHTKSLVPIAGNQFKVLSQVPRSPWNLLLSSQMCVLSHLPGTHRSQVFLCNCLWCSRLVFHGGS